MTTLFPERDQKAAWLEAADLSGPNHAPRTARAVRRLIWALETTPASSRTAEILAAKLSATARTISRLLRTAESLGILETTPEAGDVNRYRIDWPAIRRKCQPRQGTVTPDKTLSPLTISCQPQHFTNDACFSETNTTEPAAETNPTRPYMNGMNNQSSFIHQNGRAGLYPGGWNQPITRETLRTVSKVQALYEFAVARRWITTADREALFALASAITCAKHLKNPGPVWTARIKARDWNSIGTAADWEAARAAIARLDSATATPNHERETQCSAT